MMLKYKPATYLSQGVSGATCDSCSASIHVYSSIVSCGTRPHKHDCKCDHEKRNMSNLIMPNAAYVTSIVVSKRFRMRLALITLVILIRRSKRIIRRICSMSPTSFPSALPELMLPAAATGAGSAMTKFEIHIGSTDNRSIQNQKDK